MIEDALKREVAMAPRKLSKQELRARIDAIVGPLRGLNAPTWREMRGEYYDDNGLPR